MKKTDQARSRPNFNHDEESLRVLTATKPSLSSHSLHLHNHQKVTSQRHKLSHTHSQNPPHNHHVLDSEVDEEDYKTLKKQNQQLKKQLKECKAKRNLTINEYTQAMKRCEELEKELSVNTRKFKQTVDRNQNDGFKVSELQFLNKQLTTEVEMLRSDNEKLLDKLRHTSKVLENKYEDFERSTLKKIDLAIKRVKKAISYLSTLSAKEIEKTKTSLIENLQKALDLLRGKIINEDYENQVNQLMDPLNNLQDELKLKDKELKSTKEKLERVSQTLQGEQRINKELIPQYKEAVEKLKKNLVMCRNQIAELQMDKVQLKKKYESKVRSLEEVNADLTNKLTKLKVEKKLYENKLEELEGEAEEEKERLIQENQMLKKLYNKDEREQPQDPISDSAYRIEDEEEDRGHVETYGAESSFRRTTQPNPRVRNISKSGSKASLHSMNRRRQYRQNEQEDSYYETEIRRQDRIFEQYRSLDNNKPVRPIGRESRESSRERRRSRDSQRHSRLEEASQSTLRNQIDMIDQEIKQIQKTLTQELQQYK